MSEQFSVAPDVAWTTATEGSDLRVFVAPLPRGPVVVLAGTAAVVWEVALRGSAATVAHRVADAVDQPVDVVRDDIERFIEDLTVRGLLIGPHQ